MSDGSSDGARSTRSPPVGGNNRIIAPLNLKITADILHVIDGDLVLNRGRFNELLYAGWTFVQCSVTFCSLPEVASDAEWANIDAHAKFKIC